MKFCKKYAIDIFLVFTILVVSILILISYKRPKDAADVFAENFKYSINNGNIYIHEYIGNIDNVEIPQNVIINDRNYTVTKILDNAFKDSTLLRHIILPDTIDYIGASAFENCTKLENINIPLNCQRIETMAFANCKSIKSINYDAINASVPMNGELFYNVGGGNNLTLTIGANVEKIPAFLFASKKKENAISAEIVKFAGNNCKIIDECAFYNTNIRIIELPSSVEFLGQSTFRNSSVSDIKLSNGLKFLSDYTFYDCTNLQNITIPEGVEIIGIRCFAQSNLISINLPKSINYIGASAFANSRLQIINYAGTEEDWKNINVNVVKSTEFVNSKITFGQ